MSNGAFNMPQIAETVPHSRLIRSTCGPKAVKYSIIAMPLFTKARLLRNVAAWPRAQNSVETRGSHVSYRNRTGSAISSSYSSRFMNAVCSAGSRYWKQTSASTSMPGTP